MYAKFDISPLKTSCLCIIPYIGPDRDYFPVRRGADGVQVIYWYHRQFIEGARQRYCSDLSQKQTMHMALVEFFLGKWAEGESRK